MTGKQIILLGDSIIDNGAYVQAGEPDVAAQLRAISPRDTIVMRAVDGAVCADVLRSQSGELNSGDYVILSVGGNDALQHIDLLDQAFETKSRDVLVKLWDIRESLRSSYRALLHILARERRRVLALTVYNPCFEGFGMVAEDQRAAESALSIVNDVIQQEARRKSVDVLEIRTLFDGKADYANPIEPSAIGGAKLAAAMRKWIES